MVVWGPETLITSESDIGGGGPDRDTICVPGPWAKRPGAVGLIPLHSICNEAKFGTDEQNFPPVSHLPKPSQPPSKHIAGAFVSPRSFFLGRPSNLRLTSSLAAPSENSVDGAAVFRRGTPLLLGPFCIINHNPARDLLPQGSDDRYLPKQG